MEKVLQVRRQPKTGKPQYQVQWKGWPTAYNQSLFTADIDADLIQQFRLHGSDTAILQSTKTNKSSHYRKSKQGTLDMINKEKSSALSGIGGEAESQAQQPVEGISSAFLHAYLDYTTQRVPQQIRQLKEAFRKAGLIQCFDPNAGYWQNPHSYC